MISRGGSIDEVISNKEDIVYTTPFQVHPLQILQCHFFAQKHHLGSSLAH